jgi:hypothetical protein
LSHASNISQHHLSKHKEVYHALNGSKMKYAPDYNDAVKSPSDKTKRQQSNVDTFAGPRRKKLKAELKDEAEAALLRSKAVWIAKLNRPFSDMDNEYWHDLLEKVAAVAKLDEKITIVQRQ